jgi:hypothetical protein
VDELDRDPIVRCLRKYGHEGPITREDYIDFNWDACDLKGWNFEHQDQLPTALQCWDKSEWP